MVDVEVTLRHHLLQVPKAEPKTQVPTDAQYNDLGFEMSSLKQFRPVPSHQSRVPDTLAFRFATLPVQICLRPRPTPAQHAATKPFTWVQNVINEDAESSK